MEPPDSVLALRSGNAFHRLSVGHRAGRWLPATLNHHYRYGPPGQRRRAGNRRGPSPAYGGGGIERWGDYSAAVADTSGRLWMAGEYIPGTFGFGFGGNVPKGNPPGPYWLANWGTGISSIG